MVPHIYQLVYQVSYRLGASPCIGYIYVHMICHPEVQVESGIVKIPMLVES